MPDDIYYKTSPYTHAKLKIKIRNWYISWKFIIWPWNQLPGTEQNNMEGGTVMRNFFKTIF